MSVQQVISIWVWVIKISLLKYVVNITRISTGRRMNVWLHINFSFGLNSSFNTFVRGNRKGLYKLPSAVLGLAFIAGFSQVNASQNDLGPEITLPAGSSGKSCVLPSAEMRREHPDVLKHDRIQTLREGVRAQADGEKLQGSLKQCVNCHAIKDDNDQFVRVDNDKHFCVSCHQYAAVSIDCFQCHRDIPEGSKNFHTLNNHSDANYRNIVPGTYSLSVKDLANIAPEVSSDDN
jgi:hypothetical protein